MADAWSVEVTREPEWDEGARGRALALIKAEAELCRCGCGLPMSIAHDPKQPFKVGTWICYAGRAKTRVERQWEAKNKGTDGKLLDPAAADGLHHYVTHATPDDIHEQKQKQKEDRQTRTTNRRMGASRGH